MSLYLVNFILTEYAMYEKPVEESKTILVKAPDKDCVEIMINYQYVRDDGGSDYTTIDIESIEKCLDWEDFNK